METSAQCSAGVSDLDIPQLHLHHAVYNHKIIKLQKVEGSSSVTAGHVCKILWNEHFKLTLTDSLSTRWRENTHLVSAVIHGCLSWALATSQCLRPSRAPLWQGTGAGTEAGTETGIGTGTGVGTGSPRGFGFSFPDQELLSPRRRLGRRYLQLRKNSP